MKKSFVVLALAAMPLSGFAAQESYTIDPLGFSTMHGRFGKTTGKLTVDREKGTGSVNVKIDASSVNTGFDKRDDHLRSPDFLNVIEFPEITYKSTKVTIKPDKTGVVEGNLTFAGVTKPERLDVKRMNCAINPMDPKKEKFVCGIDATTKLKRSDIGVKIALPAEGDEMNIALEVEAIRD